MKSKLITIIILGIICAAVLSIQSYSHNREIARLKQYIGEIDVLRIEGKMSYSKLQLTTSERLAKEKVESKELKGIIESRNEKIEQYRKIKLQQDSTIFALQQGVVEEDSIGETIVHIIGYQSPYTIDGTIWCTSGKWSLRIDRDPFALECIVVKTRLGAIRRLYISTGDATLKIQDVQFNVVPERKGFLRNLSFDLGATYSRPHGPGIILGLGHDQYTAGVIGHEHSLGIYFIRSF